MTPPLPPGSVIGVLGTGQLGRMFAIAARQMGYRVHAYSPDSDTPAGQVADHEWTAPYDDLKRLREFAGAVKAVTFEFENVPSDSVAAVAALVPVRPSGQVLHTSQHRLREKTFLAANNFPIPRFKAIQTWNDLSAAIQDIGFPGVLKTAGFGYDGKGQAVIRSEKDASAAFQKMNNAECVMEAFVDFEREVSVVAVRGADGAFAAYPVFENRHANHILDVTVCPAPIPEVLSKKAHDLARKILEKLDVVGVMCIEMFVTKKQELLVNELAPRPHNSGHLTIDACVTSQFEQQARAVIGLPLGSTELLTPAAMANLLGDVWKKGEPRWERALAVPGVKLHLYGKAEPRPGRKMGHLTAVGTSVDEARERVLKAREAL